MTGLALIAVLALLIAFLPTIAFSIVMALVVLLAADELCRMMCPQATRLVRAAYLALILCSMFLTWHIPVITMWVALGFWILLAAAICTWPFSYFAALISRFTLLTPVFGVLMLVPAWLALSHLPAMNAKIDLVAVIAVVASADIFAYFAGSFFGQHLLAPEISPKKSWEGALGGVLGALLTGELLSVLFKLHDHWWLWLLIAVMSIFGDLAESVFKRVYRVKDSGNILPGHGGVFDRIDGLVAALPVYFLFMVHFS